MKSLNEYHLQQREGYYILYDVHLKRREKNVEFKQRHRSSVVKTGKRKKIAQTLQI